MGGATTVLLLIAIVIAAFALVVYIQSLLVKKAVRTVIARFRAKGAISPKKATSLYELGLEPADFLHRIGRTRDYKPQAMRLLVQKNVIRGTEDGKVYLSEDELRDSTIKKFANVE
ncbi:MAG: hypothetical protein JW990_16905 [Thermoleophilia bacterium]|nr:hypothetical protein [Thermoleophilia bacterium]